MKKLVLITVLALAFAYLFSLVASAASGTRITDNGNFLTEGEEREIELALIKLYRLTGVKKYLDLCAFFINERGCHPDEHDTAWNNKLS